MVSSGKSGRPTGRICNGWRACAVRMHAAATRLRIRGMAFESCFFSTHRKPELAVSARQSSIYFLVLPVRLAPDNARRRRTRCSVRPDVSRACQVPPRCTLWRVKRRPQTCHSGATSAGSSLGARGLETRFVDKAPWAPVNFPWTCPWEAYRGNYSAF